jgi:NitT/TauT family transport system substrate-binding protein
VDVKIHSNNHDPREEKSMQVVSSKLLSLACAAVVGTALLSTPSLAADKVTMGMLRAANVTFVAKDKGFFAAEGIDFEHIFFRSGAALVPSLSTGQIDVAMTSPGAALYNAMAQGVNALIVAGYSVADPGRPGGDPNWISVRQDLVDSGKVKSAKDLKGMTVAITARGQFTNLFADEYLKSGGLSEKDVRVVNMSYPDMLAAFQGKSIDAGATLDPYAQVAEKGKFAGKAISLSKLLPGFTLGVVMYGDRLGKKDRDLGMRFMRALAKANTYTRNAVTTPEGRKEIAEIYQKYAPQKSAAVYADPDMGLSLGRATVAVDVDGKYGLRWQLDWYHNAKLVPTQPDLAKVVDNSFANAADKAMAANGKSH